MKRMTTTLSMILLLSGLVFAAQAPVTITLNRPDGMDDAAWARRKAGLAMVIESGKTRHKGRVSRGTDSDKTAVYTISGAEVPADYLQALKDALGASISGEPAPAETPKKETDAKPQTFFFTFKGDKVESISKALAPYEQYFKLGNRSVAGAKKVKVDLFWNKDVPQEKRADIIKEIQSGLSKWWMEGPGIAKAEPVADLQYTMLCPKGKACGAPDLKLDGYTVSVKESGGVRLLTVAGPDGKPVDPSQIHEIAAALRKSAGGGWRIKPVGQEEAPKLAKGDRLDLPRPDDLPKSSGKVVIGADGLPVYTDGSPVKPRVEEPKLKDYEVPAPAPLAAYDADEARKGFVEKLMKDAGVSRDAALAAYAAKTSSYKERLTMTVDAARDAVKGLDGEFAEKIRRMSDASLRKLLKKDPDARQRLTAHYMNYMLAYIKNRVGEEKFDAAVKPEGVARLLVGAYTEGMGRVAKKLASGEYEPSKKYAKEVLAAFDAKHAKDANALGWGRDLDKIRAEHDAAAAAKKKEYDAALAAWKRASEAPNGPALPAVFDGYRPPDFAKASAAANAVEPLFSGVVNLNRVNRTGVMAPIGRGSVGTWTHGAAERLPSYGDKVRLAADAPDAAAIPTVYLPADKAERMKLNEGDFVTVFYKKDGRDFAATAVYRAKTGDEPGPAISPALAKMTGQTAPVSEFGLLFVGHPGSRVIADEKTGADWTPPSNEVLQSLGAHLFGRLGLTRPVG